MKEILIKQLNYEKWANEIAIDAIIQAQQPEPRSFELISHLLNSFSIWLSKIKNEKPEFAGWTIHSLDRCKEINDTNFKNWTEYINVTSEYDWNQFISFNFYNVKSKITVSDLLIHLVNHSSYHRGQIIASLKGKLEVLPLTTYIAYAKTEI